MVIMKLPVFEEVKTSDFSVTVLLKLLHRYGAGKSPLFVHLTANDPETAKMQADHIAKALRELGVHPQLPFPCYVITTQIKNHSDLTVVSEEKLLPDHFHKKPKRLKNKEQSLLNRVRLVADKLTNQDLVELDKQMNKEMEEHRNLYRATRENHFLEQLVKGLNK